MKGNCLVAQSGGPTSAINASLCGVYQAMAENPDVGIIYGGINGIQGVLEEKLLDLKPILSQGNNLEILKQTPSSSLGSCRFKLGTPADKPQEFARIFEVFDKYDIRYFFYIGGNDSMDTVYRLSEYAKTLGRDMQVMGVPKTVDNDLVCIDHTPGFGSCAKFIATTIQESALDNMVYDMESAFVVEAMGRDAGWIAMSAALATDQDGKPACDLIYTPETPFDKAQFLADVAEVRAKKDQFVVVVSEGIKGADGVYLSDTGEVDSFGHTRLRGAGSIVEDILRDELSIKVRDTELSLLQRCAAHSASATDIEESFALGKHAAKGALEGLTGKMASLTRVSDAPYKVEYGYADVSEVANAVKNVPDSYFNAARNHVSEEGLRYLRPLIVGNVDVLEKNGTPEHLNLAAIYRSKQ